MVFGERLRLAREARGMTQTELAAACNTSQYMVSYWEKKTVPPGGHSLVRLCKVLEVSPSYLLGMDEETDGPPVPVDLVSILRGPHAVTLDGYELTESQRTGIAQVLKTLASLLAGETQPAAKEASEASNPVADATLASMVNYPKIAVDPEAVKTFTDEFRAAWSDYEPQQKPRRERTEKGAEQEVR